MVGRVNRRTFPTTEKPRIPKGYEHAERGEWGTVLRQENLRQEKLCASPSTVWRQQRERGAPGALSWWRGPKLCAAAANGPGYETARLLADWAPQRDEVNRVQGMPRIRSVEYSYE